MSPKFDPFVHLHVHTAFSMLDGHALVDELAEHIHNIGQKSFAISDHGNMHATVAASRAAKKYGLKFIPGIEAYMTPGGEHHTRKEPIFFGNRHGSGGREEGGNDVSGKGAYTHMTLLAESRKGMHNLFDMSTLSYAEGSYKKPRISVEMLAEHSEGVIATTGCPSGDIQTYLRLGQYDNARNYAGRMQEILGKDNYFVELMDHEMRSDLERGVRKDLMRLAKELNIPLLATNDLHYTKKEDAKAHEAMLAMQTGAYMSEPPDWKGGKRFAFEGNSYYAKTAAEMLRIFPEDQFPGAISNTLWIAERAEDIEFKEDVSLRPAIDIPAGYSEEEWLRKEVHDGLVNRYGKDGITPEIRERANYETEVIVDKNYVMYFLVVSDFVRWAKNNEVMVGPARGCLTGDTDILTPLGFKKLRDVEAGDTVFDQTGAPVVIPNKMEYETNEDLIEIVSHYGGHNNKMTFDHKVLVRRFDESGNMTKDPEWIRADEVRPGDFLTMPRKLQYQEVSAESKMGSDALSVSLTQDSGIDYLIGLFLAGNGTVDNDHTISFTLTNRAEGELNREDFVRFVTHSAIASYDTVVESKETTTYSVSRSGLGTLFREILPETQEGHYVAILDNLIRTSESFQYGLFEGINVALGHTKNESLTFTVKSPAFAQSIFYLATTLGLPAKYCENSDGGFTVSVPAKLVPGLPGKDGWAGRDFIHYLVEDVKVVPGEGKVYDFTVPTTSSYVTSSGVVHNSGGGSLLAYALDITDIDPIRHKLLFERFLNPERDSPPDIDMDFDERNRERVIQYVVDKYGADYVAMIATYSTMGGKSALKDAARILEIPYGVSDRLSKVYPDPIMGKNMSLGDVYNPNAKRYDEAQDFRDLVDKENARNVYDTALGVDGRIRQTGVHAAGVIMSSRPIHTAIPLMTRQKDGATITQFDYPTCESLGLLKMDFLGLKNLNIIHDAFQNIKKTKGREISMLEIFDGPMDDPKTYELLQSGKTLGVFQLDGGGLQDLLRRMQPKDFNDISAAIALYRPGPMGVNAHNDYADRKNGRQAVKPIHPELEEALEPILGDTGHLVVYQEQIMQAAQELAGYSLGQADMLRRAMGKKKREILDAEFVGFEAGMIKNGFSKESIKALWEVFVPFADYAFNRSHSAGYGLISYITAYLKANYPSEYMAALLTSADTTEKKALYLAECRSMGLKVLSPDVSRAHEDFSPIDDETIMVGLSSIRGVGEASALGIMQEVEKNGPYQSVSDFMDRAPREALNKRVLEGLIDGGAFDAFGHSRRALIAILPDAAKTFAGERKKKDDLGQDSLFAAFEDMGVDLEAPVLSIPDVPEFPKKDKLGRERSVLGLYVSDHPLSGMENSLKAFASNTISQLLSGEVSPVEGFVGPETKKNRIAGIVSAMSIKRTKKGDQFAILTIEDMTGSIEAPLFPSSYQKFQDILFTDSIYSFVGVPRQRDPEEPITFMIDSLTEIEATSSGKIPVWYRLHENQCTPESLRLLRDTLAKHPGETPVLISFRSSENDISQYELGADLQVNLSQELTSEVQELFGIQCIGKW